MEKKTISFLFGAGAELAYGMPTGAEFSMNILHSEQNRDSETLSKFRNQIENWKNETDLEKKKWLFNNRKKSQFYQFTTTDFAKIIESGLEKNSQYIIDKVADYIKNEKNQLWFQEVIDDGEEEKVTTFEEMLIQFLEMKDNLNSEQLQVQLTLRYIQQGYRYAKIYNDLHDKNRETKQLDFFGNDIYADYVKLNYNKFETIKIIAHLKTEKKILKKQKKQMLEEKEKQIYEETDYQWATFEVRTDLYNLLETIINHLIDYQSLVDQYWHYLLNPGKNWSKFTKISTFLFRVEEYLKQTQENSHESDSYYEQAKNNFKEEINIVATTNYTKYSFEQFGEKVKYLNGSLEESLELYSNRILDSESTVESSLTVPFLFTQSGTKALVNIKIAQRYSEVYQAYKESDCVCIIGYGFNNDDSHINSMIAELLNDSNFGGKIFIFNYGTQSLKQEEINQLYHKLRLTKADIASKKLVIKQINEYKVEEILWYDWLKNNI